MPNECEWCGHVTLTDAEEIAAAANDQLVNDEVIERVRVALDVEIFGSPVMIASDDIRHLLALAKPSPEVK